MPYINNIIIALIALFITKSSFGQTNDLTNSPYSLFGLGTASHATTGMSSGLGNTGIGRIDLLSINSTNAASYAGLTQNSVVLDIGGYVSKNYLVSDELVNEKTSGNFSNVAFAFKPSAKLGFGMTLVPSTNVGYTLLGLQGPIEGSTDSYISDVHGSGGINKLSMGMGYQLTKRLSAGANLSYLFGRIDEKETIYLGESVVWDILYLNDVNHYESWGLSLGAQYQVLDNLSFGVVAELPTTLQGTQDRTVQKRVDFITSTVEEYENQNIEDFQLPLKLGAGFSSKLGNRFYFFGDYETKFWSATDQSDGFGTYQDQHIFKLGLQYHPKNQFDSYWAKAQYNLGFIYDTGYLNIEDKNIDTKGFSVGIGLPIGKNSGSFIHLGYQYQLNGSVNGILVEENRNIFSVNISLRDLWFMKSYLD